MQGIYESPVPPNVDGMADVRPEDGEQEGEVLPILTYDEMVGGAH